MTRLIDWRRFWFLARAGRGATRNPEEFEENGGQEDSNGFPWFIRDKKTWKEWWWKKYNKKCLRCARECKQSWRVKLVRCRQFEEGTNVKN